jgi:hypothetical protein
MWQSSREQILPLDCGRRQIIKEERLDDVEDDINEKYGQQHNNVMGLSTESGDSNNNNTTNTTPNPSSDLYNTTNCSQRNCSNTNNNNGNSHNNNNVEMNGIILHGVSHHHSSSSSNNNGRSFPVKKTKLSPMNWNHVPSVRLLNNIKYIPYMLVKT